MTELSDRERAVVQRFEEGPDAPESIRERVARALFDASQDPEDFYPVAWENNYARDEWYALADAAIDAMRAEGGDGR